MTPGSLTGVDLAGILGAAGVLDGEVKPGSGGVVYPLAIPHGVDVAIPLSSGQGGGFMAALLGKREVLLGNDNGRLRLVVPNLPMAAAAV